MDKSVTKYTLKCKRKTLAGPCRASRKRNGSAPGQQAAERLFMTHGQAAQRPDSNRISECVSLRLLKDYQCARNRPKDCKGKTLPFPLSIVHTYQHYKQLLEESRVIQDQTTLVLVTVNNNTVSSWVNCHCFPPFLAPHMGSTKHHQPRHLPGPYMSRAKYRHPTQ
ncbi:unnamed protein product [Pleuronectes platessa]|uniref:Uncharacterized protein n=1 Tax=Pleuronectes platessa TaxID=8262 RepID=A0A9N7U7V1_PLEPL|nr:unnamed protein product [Pleuronectes platessa]